MGRRADTFCASCCCLLTIRFFNVHMYFLVLYKMERAPDCYDARRLLEHWVSSLLFSFSCVSSKYHMRTAGRIKEYFVLE